jgi:hypothetical protein
MPYFESNGKPCRSLPAKILQNNAASARLIRILNNASSVSKAWQAKTPINMKKILSALCLFITLFSATAIAFPYRTGNDLITGWREYQKWTAGQQYDKLEVLYYMGYVHGAFDGNFIMLKYPNDGISVQQICSIVGRWLDDHPQAWSKPSGVIVCVSILDAMPECSMIKPKQKK